MNYSVKVTSAALFFTVFTYGQYSNYYGSYNHTVKADVNIKQNVNVTGNINKTITSIDYGALANANATRERNRIESQRIQNEKDRAAMVAIASDPSKAFDFGTDNHWKLPSKNKKEFGWPSKLKYWYHKIPHPSLFVRGGDTGYSYINESDDGVKTELIIYGATEFSKLPPKAKEAYNDIEEFFKYSHLVEGELNDLSGIGEKKEFLHKKDLNRAKVARIDGFVGTLIYEDDYEYCITDNYVSVGMFKNKKFAIGCKVRFSVDKDLGTFEELEGRRYYLRKFLNNTISTVYFY